MPGKKVIDEIKPQELSQLLKSFDKVDENTELLENAKKESDILKLNIYNPEINLQKMSTSVVYILPDYLKNSKEKNHIQQKIEIDLYIKEFENICQQINDCIDKAYNALINLRDPSNELSNEIHKLLKDFEDTKRNLCAPLIHFDKGIEKINLNNLSEINRAIIEEVKKRIEEFKKEADNLYLYYNKIFKPIHEEIKNVCSSIELIPEPINELKETIEDLKYKFENILNTINEKRFNIHKEFKEIKNLFSI